ncbi:MAG: PQQ-binding-like beta-propeller repeat protein [Lentisphaeria bacterium]|nr:PQQ-binding-like beta-propeller repeat protein [Lentisphaeria bacterium]
MLTKLLTLTAVLLIFPAAAWQTFHGPPDLTGAVKQGLGENPGVIWRLGTGAPVSFPCLMDRERIYAFNDQGSLVVCDYDGRAIWRWTLPRGTANTPDGPRKFGGPGVLISAGVVIATEDGDVFLLKKTTGDIMWKRSLNITVVAPLNTVLGGGEELVLVTDQATGAVHALRGDTGEQVWRGPERGRSDCPPAAAKGRVVSGSCLAALHVLAADNGKATADIELGQDCQIAAGAAMIDGQVVLGDRSGAVTALDTKTGAVIWRTPLDAGPVFTTPAVTPAHAAVTTENKRLVVLNTRTGKVMWEKKLALAPSAPAIVGDQVVTTDDGAIYVCRVDTGDLIWHRRISDSISPVTSKLGVVVFGTDEGEIIAIKGEKND